LYCIVSFLSYRLGSDTLADECSDTLADEGLDTLADDNQHMTCLAFATKHSLFIGFVPSFFFTVSAGALKARPNRNSKATTVDMSALEAAAT
jgi:hypothetical protein